MPVHQLNLKGEVSVEKEKEEICLFAQTNFRSQLRRFGIKLDDRRRHMYVIGKTGMGKTTMMENMVLHDIYSGHGVGVVTRMGISRKKSSIILPPAALMMLFISIRRMLNIQSALIF